MRQSLKVMVDGSWLLLFNSKSGSFLSAFAKTRVGKKIHSGPTEKLKGILGLKLNEPVAT